MSANRVVSTIEADVLIVGAGPAGASLACFLSYNGIKGVLISRDKGTALQPRAHFTNPGAWECLRDIGLENEWRQVAMDKSHYGDYRFCNTLVGPDLARNYSFTRHPDYLGAYREVSPCEHGDVSQNVGEPLLIKYASHHGFDVRFSSKLLSFSRNDSSGLITSLVEDQVTQAQFCVVSKYLCGADGASSLVAKEAALPYNTSPGAGVALNVWYEADLSRLYSVNPGMIHYISTPDIEPPEWSIRGMNRVVRPYNEFIMSMATAPGVTSVDVTHEQVITRLQQLIGDPTIKITIKGVYRWKVNEAYAQIISKDNIFCLGDAIHRHPPGNGLGSNTCIQDAYNLAWKLAYVLQSKASPTLLESYNAERQPVAKRIVRIANDAVRHYITLDAALGFTQPTVQDRQVFTQTLASATPEGRQLRTNLKHAREAALDDVTGLGAEMNQAYASSAVYFDDEEPGAAPVWDDNHGGVRHHVVSTYPGFRLPHAWLGSSSLGEKISTHDLAGKGQFTLFTGIGGTESWTRAAQRAMSRLDGNVTINVHSIGFGCEYVDLYGRWEEKRGVEEDGAVLVRPDRTVAWRCTTLDVFNESQQGGCEEKLTRVMERILGFEPASL